jgi:hypothetical protein
MMAFLNADRPIKQVWSFRRERLHTRPTPASLTLARFWRGRTGGGGGSDLEVVGFFVQRGDQAVDAGGAQDGGEFRSPRRQLADRSG